MATAESVVFSAIQALAGGNVFPDVAPGGFATTGNPWITYQVVGGEAYVTLDDATPTTRNARVQIVAWTHTRAATAALMEQVFQALVNPNVQAVPIGGPISLFESDTLLYGSRLDVSIHFS